MENELRARALPIPTTANTEMELPVVVLRQLLFLALATSFTVVSTRGDDDSEPLIKYSQVHIYCCSTVLVSSLVVILIIKSSRQVSKRRMKYRVLQAAVALDLSGLVGAYASKSFHSIKTTFSITALLAPALFCVGVEALPFLCKLVHNLLRSAQRRLKRIPRPEPEIIVSVQGNGASYEILRKSHLCVFFLSVCGACVTYQAGLKPPGGIWRADDTGNPHSRYLYLPGSSVLASYYPGRYLIFFCCNTAAFIASITIIILFVRRHIFSSKEINYFALQVVMFLELFGMIGAFASIISLRMSMAVVLVVVLAVPLLLCTVIFMVQVFPRCAAWRRALREKIEQCGWLWLNKLFEPPNMERNSNKPRLLMLTFAVTVAVNMYQVCMDPSTRLRHQLAFSYFTATSFLASVTIIILLGNWKLPASGIRWYALWVSGILCLICFLVAISGHHWKVTMSREDILFGMFFFLMMGDTVVQDVWDVLVLGDGQDIVVLENDSSDGEMQIGIAGGGPNEEPLGLEISSSILGGALTLVLAVPVRDSIYNPMQVVGAFVVATIVSAVWRRLIAPSLLRLTAALQRRYVPTQGTSLTASSPTPQRWTMQTFCHGLCKVIRTLCLGSWVWIVTLSVFSVKPNLGMKFKISKLTSLLDVFIGIGGTPTPTLVTATPTTGTLTTATTTDTPTVTAAATTSSGSNVGHNNRLVVESRPRRNRRPNNRLVGPDWVN